MIYFRRQDVIQAILDIKNDNRRWIRKKGIEYETAFEDCVYLMLEQIDYIDKYQPVGMKKLDE
jgi:hypothetical protein